MLWSYRYSERSCKIENCLSQLKVFKSLHFCLCISYDKCMKFRGQIEEVDSLLLPSDLECQTQGRQQAPLPFQTNFYLNADYFEDQTTINFKVMISRNRFSIPTTVSRKSYK